MESSGAGNTVKNLNLHSIYPFFNHFFLVKKVLQEWKFRPTNLTLLHKS